MACPAAGAVVLGTEDGGHELRARAPRAADRRLRGALEDLCGALALSSA